jgi:hypothetical protein
MEHNSPEIKSITVIRLCASMHDFDGLVTVVLGKIESMREESMEIAIEKFLKTRENTGVLDWSILLGDIKSPAHKAADLKFAMDRAIERFLDSIHFDTVTGDWEWTRAFDRSGYSRFSFTNKYGKRFSSSGHRFSYAYFRGPIPEGFHLDHLCGFRDCVNPFHLEAVTLRENSLRQARWARRKTKRPHCIRGHNFPDHYPWPKKKRTCFKCQMNSLRSRLAKLRADASNIKKGKKQNTIKFPNSVKDSYQGIGFSHAVKSKTR